MRRKRAQGGAEFRSRHRRVAAVQRDLSSGPVHAALFAIGRHDGHAGFETRQRLVGLRRGVRLRPARWREAEGSRTPGHGSSRRARPVRAERSRGRLAETQQKRRLSIPGDGAIGGGDAGTRAAVSHSASASWARPRPARSQPEASPADELLERAGCFHQLLVDRIDVRPAVLQRRDVPFAEFREEIERLERLGSLELRQGLVQFALRDERRPERSERRSGLGVLLDVFLGDLSRAAWYSPAAI